MANCFIRILHSKLDLVDMDMQPTGCDAAPAILCKRRMVLFPDAKMRKSLRQQLQRISEYPKISQASSSRASLGFPWTIRMAGDF